MDAAIETGRRPDTTRGVIRWLVREVMGVVLVGVTLFWPAGTLNWLWGWALVGAFFVWVAANAILLIPRSPELLVERATRRKDVKSWDAALMGVVGVLTIGKHILAGLDFRNGWTPELPVWSHIAALGLALGGYALTTWAMTANAYFSMIVRLQTDRGHTVCNSGPYRIVRHPGYVGSILFELATPVLLGSWWALIPGGLAAALYVIRTALEDRTLINELPGYREFTQQTRYRLLPGIW